MDPKDSDPISNMWTSRLTDELATLDYVRVGLVFLVFAEPVRPAWTSWFVFISSNLIPSVTCGQAGRLMN